MLLPESDVKPAILGPNPSYRIKLHTFGDDHLGNTGCNKHHKPDPAKRLANGDL
jgi:hypothetical protein